MEKVTSIRSVAAPLVRANIDTDVIIPSREMKQVSKHGLSGGLFAGWRYLSFDDRLPNPEFILNQVAYSDASILLAGENFGCGSSREHAVWALKEYGIRAVIAPSFNGIFYTNCIRNGLLPIVLDAGKIASLSKAQPALLTIDLLEKTITLADTSRVPFQIEPQHRHALLNGLDPIDQTLVMMDQINEFETQDQTQRSWAYLPAEHQ